MTVVPRDDAAPPDPVAASPGVSEAPLPVVLVVFFLSGMAAMIYQVAWQRVLLSLFGVNVESVTVVVTAFMLGLGVGSLVGGWLSDGPPRRSVLLFGFAELGIGACGLVSLAVFRAVGRALAGVPAAATFAVSFALLLLPTVLMGATLPLLVAHAVQRTKNVGRSVAVLYFVNTLGSAVAALVAAVALMGHLGLTGSTRVAAGLNALVGGTILLLTWARRGAR